MQQEICKVTGNLCYVINVKVSYLVPNDPVGKLKSCLRLWGTFCRVSQGFSESPRRRVRMSFRSLRWGFWVEWLTQVLITRRHHKLEPEHRVSLKMMRRFLRQWETSVCYSECNIYFYLLFFLHPLFFLLLSFLFIPLLLLLALLHLLPLTIFLPVRLHLSSCSASFPPPFFFSLSLFMSSLFSFSSLSFSSFLSFSFSSCFLTSPSLSAFSPLHNFLLHLHHLLLPLLYLPFSIFNNFPSFVTFLSHHPQNDSPNIHISPPGLRPVLILLLQNPYK